MIMKGNNLTIAIGNQKGGVGKTTSTACIGAALALQGRRVLLIDLMHSRTSPLR